jgi:hypothetical protein
MYGPAMRDRALALLDDGLTTREVCFATGIDLSTLGAWLDSRQTDQKSRAHCPRCAAERTLPEPTLNYAYLLGLYLGDGYISVGGDPAKGVWKLRITCADAWPGLIQECAGAIKSVRPHNKVLTQQRQGCTEVLSYSKHWPCLFPQHGPGQKHTRKIELADWQQVIVDRHPGDFVRGLFHSDGYRGVNRVRGTLSDGDRQYEYPRYLFVNMSEDILRLCGQALDELHVAWRFSKPTTISVARRDAVARLDEFVGPKY